VANGRARRKLEIGLLLRIPVGTLAGAILAQSPEILKSHEDEATTPKLVSRYLLSVS
jgi:hypothetical protein